jgi:RNA polymerase sigma factor (sigma-70 family)
MTQRIPPEVAAQVARLFVEASEAVFRCALRATFGDEEAAKDLVQRAFATAAEHWDKLAPLSPADRRGWLRTVAIRRAADEWRTWKQRQSAAKPEDVALESRSPEDVALTRMQAERCLKVISEMPEIRRRVAYLKFHEDWTNLRIAEHLGISPNTVGKHVFDARADLKRALPEMTLTDDQNGQADAAGEEAP